MNLTIPSQRPSIPKSGGRDPKIAAYMFYLTIETAWRLKCEYNLLPPSNKNNDDDDDNQN